MMLEATAKLLHSLKGNEPLFLNKPLVINTPLKSITGAELVSDYEIWCISVAPSGIVWVSDNGTDWVDVSPQDVVVIEPLYKVVQSVVAAQ